MSASFASIEQRLTEAFLEEPISDFEFHFPPADANWLKRSSWSASPLQGLAPSFWKQCNFFKYWPMTHWSDQLLYFANQVLVYHDMEIPMATSSCASHHSLLESAPSAVGWYSKHAIADSWVLINMSDSSIKLNYYYFLNMMFCRDFDFEPASFASCSEWTVSRAVSCFGCAERLKRWIFRGIYSIWAA